MVQEKMRAYKLHAHKPLKCLVRPERFELPTYWFVGMSFNA